MNHNHVFLDNSVIVLNITKKYYIVLYNSKIKRIKKLKKYPGFIRIFFQKTLCCFGLHTPIYERCKLFDNNREIITWCYGCNLHTHYKIGDVCVPFDIGDFKNQVRNYIFEKKKELLNN